MQKLKSLIRDLLPIRFQVPIKHWYSSMQNMKEPEMELLQDLLSPGDHAVDVGANRGIYSYCISKLGCKLDIFEPNPDCLRLLKAWSKDLSNISTHPYALSNKSGISNLYIPIDSAGLEHDASASIQNNNFLKSRNEKIETMELDTFNFKKIKFIKIDVEGHEFEVLLGATQTIAESMPALLIEIEQRHNKMNIEEIFDHIIQIGYEGFFLKNSKLFAIHHFDINSDQAEESFGNLDLYINNFLFLPSKKISASKYKTLFQNFPPGQ